MSDTSNIYRKNLNTLISIKEYDSVYLSHGEENQIKVDNRYIKSLRPTESVKYISQVLSVSFFHFINLIHLPEMDFTDSSANLNKLCNNEYRYNTLDYLDNSLEGLKRLIVYYQYYAIQHCELLVEIYNKILVLLKNIRKDIITPSPTKLNDNTSDLENSDLENSYIESGNTEVVNNRESSTDENITENIQEEEDNDGLNITITTQPIESLKDNIKNNELFVDELNSVIRNRNNRNNKNNRNNDNSEELNNNSSNQDTDESNNDDRSCMIPQCEGYNNVPILGTIKHFFFSTYQRGKEVVVGLFVDARERVVNLWNNLFNL